jgi:hypothetical protein
MEAMMTKKDFELIAGALLEARPPSGDGDDNPLRRFAFERWQRTAWSVCRALASTNPRFDRGVFMAACGGREVEE